MDKKTPEELIYDMILFATEICNRCGEKHTPTTLHINECKADVTSELLEESGDDMILFATEICNRCGEKHTLTTLHINECKADVTSELLEEQEDE
jgi:thymidine kinase